MKKLFLVLGLLFLSKPVFATWSEMWTDIPRSSFTAAATVGPMMFSSQTVQIVGVTVSTNSANGRITFYRSTSAIFTPDIATQTWVNTSNAPLNTFIPLFDMRNSSYTYMSKEGTAEVTIWLHCPDKRVGPDLPGFCPGLKGNGQR